MRKHLGRKTSLFTARTIQQYKTQGGGAICYHWLGVREGREIAFKVVYSASCFTSRLLVLFVEEHTSRQGVVKL